MAEIINGHTTPLCFLPSGKMVCYKEGNLMVYSGCQLVSIHPLFNNIKEKIIGRSKLLFRLLRLGVRSSIAIDDTHLLLSMGSSIYEFDLRKDILSKGFFVGEKIRPLVFTEIFGLEGFSDGIYFGGYLENKGKRPVSIYRRVGVDNWEVVFTFSKGEINHVHNIVVDSFRNCLWVFTGDFDNASAIWKVSDHFKTVDRLEGNSQRYRGCVAYALPEGLLYATDAPFLNNFIYLLNPETRELKELLSIDGSCIYGCRWKGNYVFSTTVEGDGRNLGKWEFLFGHKRGAGIKNNYVHMYCGNLEEGFKKIYKESKDRLPFYTFQFGVFKFPSGANNDDFLYFQPVATQKNDLDLLAISKYK